MIPEKENMKRNRREKIKRGKSVIPWMKWKLSFKCRLR